VLLIIVIIGVIYLKRRRRLLLQQARRIAIDPDGPPRDPVTETEVEEVPGTLMPFTLPLSLNTQLQPALTNFSPTPSPPVWPNARDQTSSKQAPRNPGLTVDSEGRDTLLEMVHHLQERVAYLEGRSSGERVRDRGRQRLQRTSTSRSSDDPIETRSGGTSDAPPIYKE
jgi:hypothetical protein